MTTDINSKVLKKTEAILLFNLFKKGIHQVCHDKALLASGINQLWRLLASPLTMVLIAHFLSEETQGYWYSFISICAMSVFADLGFTAILSQFAAHEIKSLRIENNKFKISNAGEELALKKLGSLFKFSRKWIFLTVVIAYPIIYLIGMFLYISKNSSIEWQIPWLIFIIFSAISFYFGSLLSFVEGCNQVARVQMIRFTTGTINSVFIIVALILHFNLFALSLGTAFTSLVLLFLIISKYGALFRQLKDVSKDFTYDWRSSIFKLLWKYAITFTSGYLVFQIYTPLAFSRFGAEFAGKIGMTMNMMMAGFTISNIWLSSTSPKLNALTADRDWTNLDILFKQRFISGLLVLITGLTCFIVADVLLKDKLQFFQRVLPILPLTIIVFAWSLQYVINGMAMYMRLHKEEPIVGIAIFAAVLNGSLTLFFVNYADQDWMFLGFLSTQIIGLPLVWRKFNYYRTVKHAV